MKKLIVNILLVIFLTGCISVEPINNTNKQSYSLDVEYANFTGFTIGRFIDKEAGVVCYAATQSISCLPISETKLKGK